MRAFSIPRDTTPRLLWLTIVLVVIAVLRLFFAANFELSPDEAYYFQWARHLDLSYYSKGPGVAWIIWLGTAFFGDSELGIRIFSPFLSLGTGLIAYLLACRMFHNTRVACWIVLAMQLTPIFNVGGVVMTIDPLSIFFWVAALWSLWMAVGPSPHVLEEQNWKGPERPVVSIRREPMRAFFWFLTGLLVGLGFICKYTNAFFLLGIVLLLAITPRLRPALTHGHMGILLAGFGLVSWPPLVWNAKNGWITLTHLIERGELDEAPETLGSLLNPGELVSYLAMHLGVYSPFICIGLFMALVWVLMNRRRRKSFHAKFCLVFILPIFALYFGLSLKSAGEPNWTLPGMVTLYFLAAPGIWAFTQKVKHWRTWMQIGFGFGLAMSLLVLNLDMVRALGMPLPYEVDPSSRLRGWETTGHYMSDVADEFKAAHSDEPFMIIASRYQIASALSFYMRRTATNDAPAASPIPPVFIVHREVTNRDGEKVRLMQNQFSFWPNYIEPGSEQRSYANGNALFITDKARDDPPDELIAQFRSTELHTVFRVERRGLPLKEFYVFACYGLRDQ